MEIVGVVVVVDGSEGGDDGSGNSWGGDDKG